MTEKIVLAFSGGLDTSYCVLDLVKRGFEVHTAFVDTGGVDEAGRDFIRSRAVSLGASQHHEINVAGKSGKSLSNHWFGATRGCSVSIRCCVPIAT